MENRIKEHPIVHVIEREELVFYWQKQPMKAKKGEMLASALIANGIKIFSSS